MSKAPRDTRPLTSDQALRRHFGAEGHGGPPRIREMLAAGDPRWITSQAAYAEAARLLQTSVETVRTHYARRIRRG